MPFQKGNKLGRKFKPGKSGNPNGRPLDYGLTAALRHQLTIGDNAERMAMAIFKAVRRGNARMAAILLERTEGRLPRPQSPDANRPLEVVFHFVDEGVAGGSGRE